MTSVVSSSTFSRTACQYGLTTVRATLSNSWCCLGNRRSDSFTGGLKLRRRNVYPTFRTNNIDRQTLTRDVAKLSVIEFSHSVPATFLWLEHRNSRWDILSCAMSLYSFLLFQRVVPLTFFGTGDLMLYRKKHIINTGLFHEPIILVAF